MSPAKPASALEPYESLGSPTMLDVWPWDGDLNEVRTALVDGRILAIPTESSYGLAVDPRSVAGVEAIYRLKERERGKPLPVVAGNPEQAIDLGVERNDAPSDGRDALAGGAHRGGAASRRPVRTGGRRWRAHWPCGCRTMSDSGHSCRLSAIP